MMICKMCNREMTSGRKYKVYEQTDKNKPHEEVTICGNCYTQIHILDCLRAIQADIKNIQMSNQMKGASPGQFINVPMGG